MKIRVFVGTGGVGKTSVTAASALSSALNGNRSLVLTVDPALRLRSALAMTGTSLEQRVPLGPACGKGELWAALLDVPATMERMVRTHARGKAQAIIAHPVYNLLVTSLAGMNELMAIERIDQAIADGFEDLYIDTAPSRHTFEFLDKPEFFVQLVSIPLVKLVGRTYNWWRKSSLGRGDPSTSDLYGRLQEMLGAKQVGEVLDFFSLFQPVAEGYARRARATIGLLHEKRTTGFTIVTIPVSARQDSTYLFDELTKRDFFVDRLIMNRLWPETDFTLTPSASAAVRDLVRWYEAVRGAQQTVRRKVRAAWAEKGRRVIDVAELSGDVDGIAALSQIAGQLTQR